LKITRIFELPRDFCHLMDESEREGFRFLTNLSANWQAGKNRFDQKGECLFGAFSDLSSGLSSNLSSDSEKDSLLGIGGLNQDPYLADPAVGRVRHVYVTSRARRLGLGRKIVEAIIEASYPHFRLLTLKTDNPKAIALYGSMGFVVRQTDEDGFSHMEKLLS
jgi:GNAT superfamily N-acetyltransferase